MKIDKEAVVIMIGGGIFTGLTKLSGDFSVQEFLVAFAFGSFMGFAALPYINSQKWPQRPFLCAIIACGGAVVLAVQRGESVNRILTLAIVGFVFGYMSPFFAKYV